MFVSIMFVVKTHSYARTNTLPHKQSHRKEDTKSGITTDTLHSEVDLKRMCFFCSLGDIRIVVISTMNTLSLPLAQTSLERNVLFTVCSLCLTLSIFVVYDLVIAHGNDDF